MVLEVILRSPGGGQTISLRIEKLTYGIHRNVLVAKFANKDKTKIGDVQASLLDISIRGVLTNVAEMQNLISAARTWWTDCASDTSDVTQLATIQWRNRTPQYMVIERLEITDMSETDSHEFEYSMEIKVDTRKS